MHTNETLFDKLRRETDLNMYVNELLYSVIRETSTIDKTMLRSVTTITISATTWKSCFINKHFKSNDYEYIVINETDE